MKFKTQEAFSVVHTLRTLYGAAFRCALFGYIRSTEFAGLSPEVQQELEVIYATV